MKIVLPWIIVSATFASLHPLHLPQSLPEFSQGLASGNALKKTAGTATATLSGTQDPNVVGFWILDSTQVIRDTTPDSIIIVSSHLREELYFAANGSAEVRLQIVYPLRDTTDTIQGRIFLNWVTAGGMFISQSTSGVSWNSSNHIAKNDLVGVGRVDTSAYMFLGGGHSVLQVVSTTVDTIFGVTKYDTMSYTKSGTTADFTLPALTASPIFAQHAVVQKALSDGTRFGTLFRYKNHTYRLSGARGKTPDHF